MSFFHNACTWYGFFYYAYQMMVFLSLSLSSVILKIFSSSCSRISFSILEIYKLYCPLLWGRFLTFLMFLRLLILRLRLILNSYACQNFLKVLWTLFHLWAISILGCLMIYQVHLMALKYSNSSVQSLISPFL